MRFAVTGANGFIGRHVLAELARRRFEAVALVRRPDIGDLPGNPELRICEVGAPSAKLVDIGSPDALIHLAWGGLPNYRSLHHFETELPAQYAFLSSLIRDGLSGLIVTGTCFEYGMQSGQLHETMQTCPNNCYGFAKDTLRQQLEMLRAEHAFNFVWARLFYPFGDGQGPSSLRSQLHAAVERGQQTFDMSAGEQLRDYIPVELVARYVVDLALAKSDCGPVNICSGEPISIRRLVRRWMKENDWSIELNLGHYPYPSHEPLAFWGSVTKLRNELGNS